jgi:FKBP-type peptidyl-prolyl cis-trans isomerase FkpA
MSPPSTSFSVHVPRLLRLALILLPLTMLLSSACGNSTQTVPTAPTLPQGPADMQVTDLVVGTGDTMNTGNQGTFIYYLWAYDPAGTDSKGALLQNGPIQLRPGVQSLITGVATGVIGMQVGGTRRLVIPPNLAYGSTGSGNGLIQPNEWVVFEFQLLEVRDCAVTTCQI